jgi:hypothetical protein
MTKNKSCTECVKQNLEKVCQARKQGLCQKHYSEINNVAAKDTTKDCKECVKQKITPVSKVHRKGLCELHYNEIKDDTQYCRVCIDTYAVNPKQVQSGYCEDHKNTKHLLKCKECVRLKIQNPQLVVNNDLCVNHGAIPKKCKVCKIENPDNANNATNSGLCKEHQKLCEKCLELKVEKPCLARSGKKFCAKHIPK